jgi:uncharacterized protein YecT (DUF1311 family)
MKKSSYRSSTLLVVAMTCTLIRADVSTSQDPSYWRALEEYLARYYTQLDRADAAWDSEMAGERAGDCLEAGKEGQQPYNACLGKEEEITRANYRDYSQAFRAIFALVDPGTDYDALGATGRRPRPEDAVRRFDEIERDWSTYLDHTCSLATDRWRGGTIAPSEGSRCELKLMRNHMRELGGILGWTFHL